MFLISVILCACLVLYVILNVYVFFQRRKLRNFKTIPVPISPIWFLGALPEVIRLSQGDTLLTTQFSLNYGWSNWAMSALESFLNYTSYWNIITKDHEDSIVLTNSERHF